MIGTSFGEWVFIRLAILFFRYTPLLYVLGITSQYLRYSDFTQHTVTCILISLLITETLFAAFVYFPATRRLSAPALHPEPLSPAARRALFYKCFDNVNSAEDYLRGWFMGADIEEIKRDNLREFLLWAFFETSESHDNDDELDEYIGSIEQRLGYKLERGRGNAKGLRLTLDEVTSTYRSLLWYGVIFAVDQLTHCLMRWNGFTFYGRRGQGWKTFPPRPQEILFQRQFSPVEGLGYWHSEHTSTQQKPVLFMHGIGVGLLTYIHFLADLRAAKLRDNGNLGIIAIELLPISFRLTQPMPRRDELMIQLSTILRHHGWGDFTVCAHSYGSVVASQMLRDTTLEPRIHSMMLVDPVSIMLHLPAIAYNFTRRQPRMANEWQLWYFASTDPGVAHCLGRHFFWRDNIIWKEELLRTSMDADTDNRTRQVTISLASKDIILNVAAALGYLSTGSGADDQRELAAPDIDVVTFPHLDHAQVFDAASDYRRLIDRLLQDQSADASHE